MSEQLEELSKKIEEAKKLRADSPENLKNDNPASAKEMSEGMKFIIELIAGVAVGSFIGYFFDQVFGTIPLFLIIFILLGAFAGFWNVYKQSYESK